jgi:hypothetical protein
MSSHGPEPLAALAGLAGDLDAATAGPEGVAEYAFIRDPQLGLGVSGPYAELAELASSLSEKIDDVATTLHAIDHVLVTDRAEVP